MNQVYLSDIPRIFTALAEWCACLVFILNALCGSLASGSGAHWGADWRCSACSSS